MQGTDLRIRPPRRWSEELGGIRWLPRLIDKARAAIQGRLGNYLYGQSPMDRSLLRALGIDYRRFTEIVRSAGGDDQAVLHALGETSPRALENARAWSGRLERNRLFLFLIDLDDGYATGVFQPLAPLIRACAKPFVRYVRYRWPARGALIGLEVRAQSAGGRSAAPRGPAGEPYRWFTPRTLDAAWKILLSVVLIFLILNYLIAFLERIGPIVLLIVGAIFFAYLIYPVVRSLNKRLPLLAAILLVYLVIVAIVVVGLSYVIPAIGNELSTLVRNWPVIQAKIQAAITDPHTPVLGRAAPPIRKEIAQVPTEIVRWVQTHGASAATNAISIILGTAAFVGALIVIPILAAYLLYDSETIKRFFVGFIPERRRGATIELLAELEQVIGGFIRGQLLVGLTVGILIAVGLAIVHVPYAILIGAATGALDLIPYVGPVVAYVPTVTLAFATGGLHLAIWATLVFVVANQAEGHLIAPNIVSRTIQLRPSAIIIAVLIGGELYGVLGMFVAVPIAGIIRVLLLHVIPGSVSREEAKPVLTRASQEQVEAEETVGEIRA